MWRPPRGYFKNAMTENRSREGSPTGAEEFANAAARDEARVEAWGRRAGRFLAGAAARIREEAEDIWADAQAVKRGERE